MKSTTAIFLTSLAAAAPALAQSDNSEWSALTSMQQINGVLATGDWIWAATQGGAMRFDTSSREYTRFTRLDGLAGNNLLSVTQDARGDLWFGTDGQGLSRLRADTGEIDPPFLDFEGLRIDALLAVGDRVYVGTNRGVSVFLIDKEEVKENYRKLGNFTKDTEVTSLAIHRGVLWVGTTEGVAFAELDQPNLQDPDSWQSRSGIDRVEDILAMPNGDILIATIGGVLFYDRIRDSFLLDFVGPPVTSLGLLRNRAIAAEASGNFFRRNFLFAWERVPGPIITEVQSLSRKANALWMGTSNGLRVIGADEPPASREPAANRFYEMKLLDNGELWVASAPDDQQEAFGLYQLGAEGWSIHNKLTGLPTDVLVSLETDSDDRLWVGTWGGGVSIRDGDDWLNMTHQNSILRGLGSNRDFVAISDIARDAAGNMWLVNVTFGLVVVDGFPPGRSILIDNPALGLAAGRDLNKIFIAPGGLKWLSSRQDGFILFDDGGTPFEPEDDVSLRIDDLYDSRLTSNRVLALLPAADGTLWVGTDNGLHAVRGTWSRSTQTFDIEGWRTYTTRDLLPTNEINDLASDADGNIWVATDNGLSQIGSDGDVAFTLTATNSGLIDNRVKSLLFDDDRGEMWIGTFDGLSRLRISSGGVDGELPSITTVYPNPYLTSGGAGELTFAGLPLGASLQIYALDGQLVADVEGVPGRASVTWNGLNEAGFIVSSGIYYYVADNGSGRPVRGRFAVVNGRDQ